MRRTTPNPAGKQRGAATLSLVLSTTAFIFIVLQLIPAPGRRAAAPAGAELTQHVAVPPAVQQLLNRSCRNCHTVNTDWPWYSRVAPASWLIGWDVERGRKAMNLSEWSTKIAANPQRGWAMLMAACADVQQQRMPPPQYLWLHPDAKPTKEEAQALCQWSQAEAVRAAKARRQKSR